MRQMHWFVSSDIRRRRSSSSRSCKDFPQNTRARAGLAALYQATDRSDRAAEAIADMLRVTPTPDTYRAGRTAVHNVRKLPTGQCRPRGSAQHVRLGAAARRTRRATLTKSALADAGAGLPLHCCSPR